MLSTISSTSYREEQKTIIPEKGPQRFSEEEIHLMVKIITSLYPSIDHLVQETNSEKIFSWRFTLGSSGAVDFGKNQALYLLLKGRELQALLSNWLKKLDQSLPSDEIEKKLRAKTLKFIMKKAIPSDDFDEFLLRDLDIQVPKENLHQLHIIEREKTERAILEKCLTESELQPKDLYLLIHDIQENSKKSIQKEAQLSLDRSGILSEALNKLFLDNNPIPPKDHK